MEKDWDYVDVDEKDSSRLIDELKISKIVAELLTSRGITDIEEARRFLNPMLENLHDPFLMKGMKAGVFRIKKAIGDKEKIMIFGDFDVDGITSTTTLNNILKNLGGDVSYYFPNRLIEGYGLNKNAIDRAVFDKKSLIITVDCGITAVEEVKYANEKGIDIIVIDHHEQKEVVPNAVAVIDPKQNGCMYPFKQLAAVGVVFKVAQALVKEMNSNFDIISLLDFVSLGTVSDLVPLIGENRIIVKYGLDQITKTKNPGLRALIKVSQLKDKDINVGHISFALGPRINSSGRLETADKVMKLFNTDDENLANEIAKQLDENNTKRRELQQTIFNQAMEKIKTEVDFEKDNCIVIAGKGWHRGVVGIVASKIIEEYNRPTILIALGENGIGHGSARSIPAFHLLNAMTASKDWMESFGGHSQAAGLSIKEENIDGLRNSINEYSKTKLTKKDLVPVLKINTDIDLSEVDFKLIEEVHSLYPYGFGNPSPLFSCSNLSLVEDPRVLKEKHLKLKLKNDRVKDIGAIGFGLSNLSWEVIKNNGKIKVAFFPEINEWNGNISIQLGLKDIKFD